MAYFPVVGDALFNLQELGYVWPKVITGGLGTIYAAEKSADYWHDSNMKKRSFEKFVGTVPDTEQIKKGKYDRMVRDTSNQELAEEFHIGTVKKRGKEYDLYKKKGERAYLRKRTLPHHGFTPKPTNTAPPTRVPTLHRNFMPINNYTEMSGRMDVVTTKPHYKAGYTSERSTGRTAYVSPCIIRHRMTIPRSIARAYCSIAGNRTFELATDVGRMNAFDLYYSHRNELNNMHTYAQRNIVVQTGIGTKHTITQGISADVAASAFANQYKSVIVGQSRTYVVTNMADKSCYVTMYVTTPRVELPDSVDGCIGDTDFEQATGHTYVKWADDVPSGEDDRTNAIVANDDHFFNMFRHRYKVRRTWRFITKKTVFLIPGQKTKFRVIETGPQVISSIHLSEAYVSSSSFIQGYTKNVRFELRGADVVANKVTDNTQVSKSSAAIAVIEHFNIRLMGLVTTRKNHQYLNQDLAGSVITDADSYSLKKAGRLPTFAKADQANINILTEAKETGETKGE